MSDPPLLRLSGVDWFDLVVGRRFDLGNDRVAGERHQRLVRERGVDTKLVRRLGGGHDRVSEEMVREASCGRVGASLIELLRPLLAQPSKRG